MAEPRYGGAYIPGEVESVDPKTELDAKCHHHCEAVWSAYKKCEERIEAKGAGQCSGQYMDYFRCIDHCSTKSLFKKLM
eukprot:CAMPEP_0174718226 /NCGR_PEP_ID=MMETSP1094-20130205/28344_1 /TAXON_ID=156173 /ORGANISM="Chrysochromulina brevifilum, Strain UTEX LB 985" /LENGTH=78 /DNA_ID=CAMNT_0015918279 /DNA_START=12 /DNA_END=248 /DNA_ORIENTATION=+